VRYGIRITGLRLCENITMIKALVEVEYIERFLSVYVEKKISLKAFDELQIQKKGVEFTKSSELSEHLPLPHTKGTKPAP